MAGRIGRPAAADRTALAAAAGATGLSGFLFFYGLNTGELYRTESLRAIVAADVLRSGDWLVPHLYGEPLLTKPPGAYAAIAAASAPFGGVTEWTARLPSAVAATLVVFLIYGCFQRHFGRTGGLTAAALLPCSLMWLDRAPSAEIDMLQVAWVAGAVLCFLRAVECREAAEQPNGRAEWLWQQAALLCVAGGTMTKWTAPAFFYLTAIPFLLWRRGSPSSGAGRTWRRWALRPRPVSPGPPPSVAARLGASVRHGEPRGAATSFAAAPCPALSVGRSRHVSAAVSGDEPAVVGGGAAALHPRFAGLWDERGRRLWQLLHCWVWPNLLFWSLVPGHAFRHGMPLQPGLAGLAAMVWIAWRTGRLRWPLPRIKPAHVFVGFVAVWLAVKLVFVHAIVPRRDDGRSPRAAAEQIAALRAGRRNSAFMRS